MLYIFLLWLPTTFKYFLWLPKALKYILLLTGCSVALQIHKGNPQSSPHVPFLHCNYTEQILLFK